MAFTDLPGKSEGDNHSIPVSSFLIETAIYLIKHNQTLEEANPLPAPGHMLPGWSKWVMVVFFFPAIGLEVGMQT